MQLQQMLQLSLWGLWEEGVDAALQRQSVHSTTEDKWSKEMWESATTLAARGLRSCIEEVIRCHSRSCWCQGLNGPRQARGSTNAEREREDLLPRLREPTSGEWG